MSQEKKLKILNIPIKNHSEESIHPLRNFLCWLFILFLLFIAPVSALNRTLRTIRIKALVDEEYRQDKDWRMDITRSISNVSKKFERLHGIRFDIKQTEIWLSDNSKNSIYELLDQLKKSYPRDQCEVIIGFTDQSNIVDDYLGVAAYLNGYIIVRKAESDSLQNLILQHELSHLFGAIDLNEPGCVMDRNRMGTSFNEFLNDIIELNRDRTFNRYIFPLPKGKIDKAIDIYTRRKKLKRRESDLNILLSLLYLEKKDLQQAINACREALNEDSGSFEAHNLLGIAYRRQGRYEEAIQEYEKVITKQPRRPEVYYNLGIAYMKKGDTEAALRAYQKALELDPNYALPYTNRAYIFLKTGKIDECVSSCQKALLIFPELPEALTTLGAALILKGDIKKSESLSLKAIKINPELPGPHTNLGNVYMHTTRYADAIQEYKKSLALDPKNPQTHFNLGKAYFHAVKYKDALHAFECAVMLDKNYYLAYFNLSRVYFELGLMDKAEIHCRQAAQLNPNLLETYTLMGRIYQSTGREDLAEIQYLESLRIDPNYSEGHVLLGNYYFKKDDPEKALDHYKQAINNHTPLPLPYNNAAVILFYQKKYKEAWKLVETAEKLGMQIHPDFKKSLLEKLKKQPYSRSIFPE